MTRDPCNETLPRDARSAGRVLAAAPTPRLGVSLVAICLLAVGELTLSGCGQTGPLTLPISPPVEDGAAAASPDSVDAKTEEEDDR